MHTTPQNLTITDWNAGMHLDSCKQNI